MSACRTRGLRRAVFLGALFLLVGCTGPSILGRAETPGQKFRRDLAAMAEACRLRPPEPANTRCDLLKVQIEDPMATPEGRFAQALKIPNPVPADSGYRPGMSSDEYFEHLCKTEAGEFIFRTVDNVEGIRLLRPRKPYLRRGTPIRSHLFAMEDPYGHDEEEAALPGFEFLAWPSRYAYIEGASGAIELAHPSLREFFDASLGRSAPAGATVMRFYGHDGSRRSLKLEYDTRYRSRYGITWRAIQRPNDREMGVAGGELIVLDVETNEVLGVRRGYAQWAGRGWGRLCPRYGYFGGSDKSTAFSFWFTGKVVRPLKWTEFFAAREREMIRSR